MHRILSKQGYLVESVVSGHKAIELLDKREFDLVVTDLKMEGIDGMDVLKYVKSKSPHTEVIMITGYATVDSAVEAMKQGAFHYIAKPYKLDEVRGIVKQALIKRGLQLENLELKKKAGTKEIICRAHRKIKVLWAGNKSCKAGGPHRCKCIDFRGIWNWKRGFGKIYTCNE